MKILIIGSRNFPPGVGGIERYVFEFSRAAASLGHEITLLVQSGDGEPKYEKKGGVEIIRCDVPSGKPMDRIFMILHTFLKSSGGYDIYWGHGTPGMVLFQRKPYVFTIHGFGYLREEDRHPVVNNFMRWWYSWMLKKTDANIAVDRQSYDIAKEINPDTHLIHNGINLRRFTRECADPYSHQRNNVLFVGRLIESKGILDLMEGFSSREDAVLHIIGSGPLKDRVEEVAASDPNIIYHGEVDEVECYFKHADVYVLPSYFEGFPTTVLEAMASGTPTAVSDISAFKGTFRDRRETLFFQPGDVTGMMKCVDELLHDKKLAKDISGRAFARVKKEYSWEAQTKKILKVFEEVIR